jgi:hypothetical protein
MFKSMDDLRNAPADAGELQEFQGAYEPVLKATQDAIAKAGLTIKDTNRPDQTECVILAERGFTAFSWGELVRVTVKALDPDTTSVRVLTMRRLKMNITAKGDFSKAIFDGIDSVL